jgi:hypothetical protein
MLKSMRASGTSMTQRLSLLSLLTLLTTTAACHSGSAQLQSVTPALEQSASAVAERVSDTESRYLLALTMFERGAYDDAAALFTQLFLSQPHDPSGDRLRHLLVQHIGWSMLGSYDVSGADSLLDGGESTLERYLVKHEQLFPAALGQRVDIYALLDEYSLRREDVPPPDAEDRLYALFHETYANIERPTPRRSKSGEDRMIREIEVDAIPWAKLSDPRVQRQLRDLRFIGASLMEQPGEPYNPRRVLVRGWASGSKRGPSGPGRRQAYTTLRTARPTLERCYAAALGRGAEVVERVELALRWVGGEVADVEVDRSGGLDEQASRCLVRALRNADVGADEETQAQLHLTFFIQPERWSGRSEIDYDYFGPQRSAGGGEINRSARPEDASINPLRIMPGFGP